MKIYMEDPYVVFESRGEKNAFREALMTAFNQQTIAFTDVLMLNDATGEVLHRIQVDLHAFENVDSILNCFENLPESWDYSSRTPQDLHCVNSLSTRLQRKNACIPSEGFSFARGLTLAQREEAVTLANLIADRSRACQLLLDPEYKRQLFSVEGGARLTQYQIDLQRLDGIGISHRVLLETYYDEHPTLGIGLK